MDIIEKNLADIVPYEHNPRKNEAAVDAVAESIREFGFKVPIVIDSEGVIVAGHTRALAAKKLGLVRVPCIVADDLDADQVRAFRLADNKTAELAEWDLEELARELDEIQAIDMERFGFDLSEFGQDGDDVVDDDFEPEIPEEPFTQRGQLWQLGEHRLIVGDSTDPETIRILMGGETADLLLTDPPYNVALGQHIKDAEEARILHRRTDGKIIQNDSFETKEDFSRFLETCLRNALECTKPGGVFYIWYAITETASTLQAINAAGLTVRQFLIWVKSIFSFTRQDYQWRHEPCLYGWKDGAAHYFINDRTQSTVFDDTPDFDKLKKDEAIDLLRSLYEFSSVIYEDKPSRSEMHPTMKPVPLFGRLIANSTRPGENVLDIFAGSGTTIIAAEQLARRAFCVEYDPHYADVIIHRWEDYTGKQAKQVKTATE